MPQQTREAVDAPRRSYLYWNNGRPPAGPAVLIQGDAMKKILVMGGAGYIGSHTVKHLAQEGDPCVVADNLVYGHREAVPESVPFEKADLAVPSSLDALFAKYDFEAVVHFAAYTYVGESVTDPQKYYQNNVAGTLNLLAAMKKRGVNKIVFSSTCATYGEPQYTPMDEKHPQNPINPYGRSKLMIEQIFADYAIAENEPPALFAREPAVSAPPKASTPAVSTGLFIAKVPAVSGLAANKFPIADTFIIYSFI